MLDCLHKYSIFAACVLIVGCGVGAVDQLLIDLESSDVEVRRVAVRELGKLKPAETEVRDALLRALSDEDREVRRLACFALGEIGEVEAGKLASALDDPELSVRLAAAYALLKIEPGHTGAKDVLTQAMQAGDGGVIVAVSSRGSDAAWAVPTLTALLSDRRPGIRRLAAEGLGKIGRASESSLPALERAENDPDDRVREAAAGAIQLIEGVDSPDGK